MTFSNVPNDDISCSTTSKESVSWSSSLSYTDTEIRAVRNNVLTEKKIKKRKSAATASKIKEAASSITLATKYLNTPHRQHFFFLGKKRTQKIVANNSVEPKGTTATLAVTSDASSAHSVNSPKIDDKMNTTNWIIMNMESIQTTCFCIGQYLIPILAVFAIIQIPFLILGLVTVVFIKLMVFVLKWIKFVFAVTDFEFEESSKACDGKRKPLMKRIKSRIYTYAWLSGVQTVIGLVDQNVINMTKIQDLKRSSTKNLIQDLNRRIDTFNVQRKPKKKSDLTEKFQCKESFYERNIRKH